MSLFDSRGRRRQGRARRLPSLEQLEADHLDDFDVGSGSFGHRVRAGSKTDLPILGSGAGCWCGEKAGHDWPGKVDGEPHPR